LNKSYLIITIFVFFTLSNLIWAQSPYWTGDGGKGIKITVTEPTGRGLSIQEQALFPLIQSTIIGSFQMFSDMTVFDKQNLENILKEQQLSLSGNFSDSDYIRIGNLTNARLVVFGSISKISNNYMLELAVTDVETGLRKASYPPRQVSLLSLKNLSAIREASAELLKQLGINLTDKGLQELRRSEDTARIQYENNIARGIAAQRQGTIVEAFTYLFKAAAYNPSIMKEAVNRISVMSASVSSGNLGQSVRNRLQANDDWRTIVQAAKTFYENHLPYEFVYDTNINLGRIDFDRRTTEFSIAIRLIPTEAWKTINDLRQGLRLAQGNDKWSFSLDRIEPRQITVNVRILNENNTVLSTGTYTFSNPSEVKPTNATLTFRNIKADDITDRLTVEVVSINKIPAQNAGETGFIQISVLSDYNRRIFLEESDRRRQEHEAAEAARRRKEASESARKQWESSDEGRQQLAEKEAVRKKQEAEAVTAARKYQAFMNNWEILPLFVQWDKDIIGFYIGTFPFTFHWSPVSFTVIGVESKIGLHILKSTWKYFGSNSSETVETSFYISASPKFGLIYPITIKKPQLTVFANAMLEMGYFGFWHGLFTDWMTPGFDIGLRIAGGAAGVSFIIKYQSTWYTEGYAPSFGLGAGLAMNNWKKKK